MTVWSHPYPFCTKDASFMSRYNLKVLAAILISASVPIGRSSTSAYVGQQCVDVTKFNFTNPETVKVDPPVAKRIPHFNQYHGVSYLDEYHWLRDETRQDKEVLNHIEDENAYAREKLSSIKSLEETIYQEIVSHITEDDISLPVVKGGFEYYSKSVKGLQYPIYCRKTTHNNELCPNEDGEEVLLDLNQFSDQHLELESTKVSPNDQSYAYALDNSGSENYLIFIKDLITGDTRVEVANTTGDVFWSDDSQFIFYITRDDVDRPYQIFRHKVGRIQSDDELLFEEFDPKFSVRLTSSISGEFLFIVTESFMSTEVHYLALNNPLANFTCFSPRVEDRLYAIEHQLDHFLILTNHHLGKKYMNFYLLASPIVSGKAEQDEQKWVEVVPYNNDSYIEQVYGLKDHIIMEGRFFGYTQIWVIDLLANPGAEHLEAKAIKFPEPIFFASVKRKYLEYNQARLVYTYSSLVTPETLYHHNLTDGTASILKQTKVGGGFNSTLYTTERLLAENNVPISVVYRKDMFFANGSNPLHLYGYGSYGMSTDPFFRPKVLSLLDRGFVYAIAHVRGGSEMGQQWYEVEGRLLNKTNSFRDFAAAARKLILHKYTSPGTLTIGGGSAGGLLVAAAINHDPDLYSAAIIDAPFVDVINTMMDPSLPLTVVEYEEWGNPNIRQYFDYMRSYSPYDNLPTNPTTFPHILMRSGLNDLRVQYWEPTKYVAKLRAVISKPGYHGNTKVFHITDMSSGHSGASGRYTQYKEEAQNYAFLVASATKSL